MVSFPSVLAFNPNDHWLAIQLVPAGLEPSTGFLGLVRYLGVVSWSIGKAGGRSCDGLRGHRVKVVLQIHIAYQICIKGPCAGPLYGCVFRDDPVWISLGKISLASPPC